MSEAKKKPEYEEKKAIVTEFEGTKFAAIWSESEKGIEVAGNLDLLGKFGLRGKKETKKVVQAVVVSDPRLPTDGPVPQKVWEDYIENLVKNQGRIKESIATAVTTISGSQVTSTDVDLRASFYVTTTPPPHLWAERKECPKCKNAITVPEGTNFCPICGQKI